MGIVATFMLPHPPIVIPKIGKKDMKTVQNTVDAYEQAAEKIGQIQPETIVIISPHHTLYADYFQISPGKKGRGNLGQFNVPQVSVTAKYDEDFVEKLSHIADAHNIAAGTKGAVSKTIDYGAVIPLVYVNKYWKNYKLVHMGISGLPLVDHYELGKCIKETAENLGTKTVVIASGDLSHRLRPDGPNGYRKEGAEYDARVMDIMENARFDELMDFDEGFRSIAGECGHRSLTVMAGALDKTDVEVKRLSYEGVTGVGYGICIFEPGEANEERDMKARYIKKDTERINGIKEKEDAYVRLARHAVEELVLNDKKYEVTEDIPKELLNKKAGVFVTIKSGRQLRGCVGTLTPEKENIAEEIIQNAMNSAGNDPRYAHIEKDELDRIEITVDVIGEFEEIFTDDMLDIHKYGVCISKGRKKGFLLPNQTGLETTEQQVIIAKQSAGLRPRDKAKMERFEVTRHQ